MSSSNDNSNNNPMIAELQKLFGEALNENDFATSTTAKRKISTILTYDTIVASPNALAQFEEFAALLSNDAMFPTSSNDDDDAYGAGGGTNSATEGTKLMIKVIGDILQDKRVLTTISSNAVEQQQIVYGLISIIVSQWLSAADVGVGSAAANVLCGLLVTAAQTAVFAGAAASSSSAGENDADDNSADKNSQIRTKTDFDAALAQLDSITSIIGVGDRKKNNTLTTTVTTSIDGETRLLDCLTQLVADDTYRDIELGNRVGLPAFVSRDGGEAKARQLSFIVPSLNKHTSIIERLLSATTRALLGVVGVVSSPQVDGGSEASDPLLLINLMNVVGALGRFVQPADCVPLREFLGASIIFIQRTFTADPTLIAASSYLSSTTSVFYKVTDSSVRGPLLNNSEADFMLGSVIPFVLRGVGTLVRNNAAALRYLLLCGGVDGGAEVVRVLRSAAAFISDSSEVPLNASNAEAVEAIFDFMAAIATQKSGAVTELLEQQDDTHHRRVTSASLDALSAIYLKGSPFMDELTLRAVLLPSKPVSADLKSSALLLVSAVLSSPLFARVSASSSASDTATTTDSIVSADILNATFAGKTFLESVYSHKNSLDDSTRRACWHALVAYLQQPYLRSAAAPSVAAHLAGLAHADYAESNMEVRRSQLYCCDLLLKMDDMKPFHDKLTAERKSGLYSKPQPGMTAPSVGMQYGI